MDNTSTNTDTNEGLFSAIIAFTGKLIKALKKTIKVRTVFAILGLIIGTFILVWTLNQRAIKDLGSPGAAMIALSGVFYGTISLALLLGILDRSEKLTLAQDIQTEFKPLSNSTTKSQDEKIGEFESHLLDILKTIFAK